MVAGEPTSSSSAMTASGSVGVSRSGSSNRRRLATASGDGATFRSWRLSRYRDARSAVAFNRCSIPCPLELTGARDARLGPSAEAEQPRPFTGRCRAASSLAQLRGRGGQSPFCAPLRTDLRSERGVTCGQPHRERAARPEGTLDRDLAALQLGKEARDREAEPAPPQVPAARLIDAEEA